MGSKKGSPSENDSDAEAPSTRDERHSSQIESDDCDEDDYYTQNELHLIENDDLNEEHYTGYERQLRQLCQNESGTITESCGAAHPYQNADSDGLILFNHFSSSVDTADCRYILWEPFSFDPGTAGPTASQTLLKPWAATRNEIDPLLIGFPPAPFPSDTRRKSWERESNYPDVEKLTVDYPDLPHMLRGLQVSLCGFATWVRGRAGEANTDTKGKGPANPSTHLHPSQSAKRKRSATGDEEGTEDSQDDGRRGKKPRLKSSETDEGDGPLLSCPFYKRNPLRYSRCLCFRLKRIADVKQHLRRKHEQPHYCAFCGEKFESQAALRSHDRDRSCTRAEFEEPEGVSDDQRRKLALKVSRKKAEAEQWFEIWAILFPNTERPDSAYVERPALEIISTFREYWTECGEGVVTETLAGAAVPTGKDDVEGMVRVLFFESMGTLLDRFTQRYSRNPPSVSDNGVSSTPSSNPTEPKATGVSTPRHFAVNSGQPAPNSGVSTFKSASFDMPGTETLHTDQVPNDLILQLEHGCNIGAPSLAVDSSDHTFAAPVATFGYPKAQGDVGQWDTPYHGVLPDSDVELFDDLMNTFVNPEESSTEGWY